MEKLAEGVFKPGINSIVLKPHQSWAVPAEANISEFNRCRVTVAGDELVVANHSDNDVFKLVPFSYVEGKVLINKLGNNKLRIGLIISSILVIYI